jgi:hypothetical protein
LASFAPVGGVGQRLGCRVPFTLEQKNRQAEACPNQSRIPQLRGIAKEADIQTKGNFELTDLINSNADWFSVLPKLE